MSVDAKRLKALLELIQGSGQKILSSLESPGANDAIPPHDIYEATQTLLGAAGMMSEVVQDPGMRCLQMCGSFFEARALHIAVRAGIPDLLAKAPGGKLSALELGKATGIEHKKLARILRLLATNHMLSEVGVDVYANNRISKALVNNPGLCAYIIHYGEEPYRTSDALMYKLDTPAGHSYDILDAAFSDVYGRKPRWEWLEEPDEKTGQPREQLARFGLAMLGAGDVEVPGVLADYAWGSLPKDTLVVDVGGGVGQMCIALGRKFDNLRFVVQDRAAVIEQGKEIWKKQAPELLNRATLQAHDFYQVQPVKNADIYFLRHVLHDWSDEDSKAILAAIKPAMGPSSKILLAEQIMVCAIGDDRIKRAPYPLPSNYGNPARFSHQRDINMCGLINGIERSPSEWDELVSAVGLRVTKFHECRSQIGIIEIGL